MRADLLMTMTERSGDEEFGRPWRSAMAPAPLPDRKSSESAFRR